MPLMALVLAAALLNRGSIPFGLFGLFGRDDDPATAADAAGIESASGAEAGAALLPTATGGIAATDPEAEADARKFTVAVAPPDFDDTERLSAIAVPAFHSYLLKELETILHIEIVELPEPTDELTPDDADFYLQTEGERNPGEPPTWTIRVRWTAMREGTATWAKVHESVDTELLEVSAREAVASLRRYPFPPTDLRTVELQSMAIDSELTLPERLEVLEELHDIRKRYEFVGRDERRRAAVAGAAIVLGAPEPEIRSQTWQAMEGVEDAYLVGPLVDSLLLDPSDAVRVEAAKLLAREYSDDPRTQSAMQHALANDRSPLVRSHARWEGLDPEGRRAYLVATLGNRDLPDQQRMELVAADVNDIRNYLDRRAVSALMEISSRATPAAEIANGDATTGSVAAAQVTPMLIELLKDSTVDEWVRRSIAMALSRHLADPEVLATFQELAGTTSFGLRGTINTALRNHEAQVP